MGRDGEFIYHTLFTPQVGGDKYFNVYCPEYGVDSRVFVEQLGVPSIAKWHAGAKTLVMEPAGAEAEGPGGSKDRGFSSRNVTHGGGRAGRGNAGRGRDGGRSAADGRGGRGGGSEAVAGGATDARLDPCGPDFCYNSWINALAASAAGGGGILNLASLKPVSLPLQVGVFMWI